MQTRLQLKNSHEIHPDIVSLPAAQMIVTGLAIATAILALVELAAR